MDSELRRLEADYCPPLDPSLVHALIADYADTEEGMADLEAVLDGLRQAAITEQLTEFDPSGSSGIVAWMSPGKRSDDVESNTETWATRTTVTEYTNLSSELETLDLGPKRTTPESNELPNGGYFQTAEGFDSAQKERHLAETFPTLRVEFVAYTLKKCEDSYEKATDELLNHVYFEDVQGSPDEEQMPVAKGIEAFSEDYHLPQRGKKGKRRKLKRLNMSGVTSSSNSETELSPVGSVANRWKDGGKDVAFLASRTNIPAQAITSLYHQNGLSLRGTIMALIEKTIKEAKAEPDATAVQQALELYREFRDLEPECATALIWLTAPSTAHAHELAAKLAVCPSKASASKGRMQVIPQYAPVPLSNSTPESWTLPALPPSATPRTTSALLATRSEAFTQASTAYRKGRSNPLFKAAAGYYAQVGRDANAHFHAQSAVDADSFVAQQSTTTVLDLHGVSVDNATRLAREKTKAWWDGLGEARLPGYGQGKGGPREGYRIVTGLGRHSEGGKGKIGPAVFRALVKEGWRIEVGTGELVVTGKARARTK